MTVEGLRTTINKQFVRIFVFCIRIYMYGFIRIYIFQKTGFLRKQSGNTDSGIPVTSCFEGCIVSEPTLLFVITLLKASNRVGCNSYFRWQRSGRNSLFIHFFTDRPQHSLTSYNSITSIGLRLESHERRSTDGIFNVRYQVDKITW